MHRDRDSDLTGSVDHAQCCTLHATAQSLYGRRAFEPVERPTGRGNGNGLELSKRREKHHFFPSKRNKEQTRHVLFGTIKFHLMLVAIRKLVELVHSRRRLGGAGYTPVEGPISGFQWRTREKVLGGTKSECVRSAAQR